ncbi:MAG: hypothetical protein RR540_07620, partial [Oscillospiraceae bacterium]
GEYANKDTNTNVEVNAQSIKEVLHHDYKDVEQIQSVAAPFATFVRVWFVQIVAVIALEMAAKTEKEEV